MSRTPWDIRRQGRAWSPAKAQQRLKALPKQALVHGKLYRNQHERLYVLGCLLENVGLDAVVSHFASPALWLTVRRAQFRVPSDAPVAEQLAALAAQGALWLADVDSYLAVLFEALERLAPELAVPAREAAGDPYLAALMLFTPTEELGGQSIVQRCLTGDLEAVFAYLERKRPRRTD